MNWQTWKTKNAQKLQHIVGFEEMFVDKVLSQIPEITPDDVVPQYHFKDSTGNRYIDFMIINQAKGYCLPIELDGYAKMVGNGNDYQRFNDFLQRQNAIISQFGLVLRYANKTMLNNSQLIISEIRDTLQKQSQHKSTQQIKESHTQQIIADYQNQINQLNKVPNQTQHFQDLSSQISQLKQQIEKVSTTSMVQPVYIQPQKQTSYVIPAIAGLALVTAIAGFVIYNKNDVTNPSDTSAKTLVSEVANPLPATASNTQNETPNHSKEAKPTSKPSHNTSDKPKEPAVAVTPPDTKYTVGQTQKVCGLVAEVKDFAGGTYLNLGSPYPNQDISIVVWKEHNLNEYLNSSVCTTGVVQNYKNKLQVNVNNLSGVYKTN